RNPWTRALSTSCSRAALEPTRAPPRSGRRSTLGLLRFHLTGRASKAGEQRFPLRRQPVADLEAERQPEYFQLADIVLEFVARPTERASELCREHAGTRFDRTQRRQGPGPDSRPPVHRLEALNQRRQLLCRDDARRGLRTRAFAVVVEVDDENALAGAVLRDLDQIDERLEAATPRQSRRDVVEPCLVDLVDDDRAASEGIAAAHFDV